MDVMTRHAGPGLAVVAEDFLQFLEQIGFRTEMAEMLVAALGFLRHFRAHLKPIVAVEGIPLDIGGCDLFATEDVFKRLLHRGRAGTGRTRDRYDGIAT